MTQRKDDANLEPKNSILEHTDAVSTSKNNVLKTEPETVYEAKVETEKSFSERWKTNRFWLVRGTYFVLRSVWMVVMFIGGLIVWLISLLFI
ncbi:hypothetical protein O4H26_11125 [Aequorivita viscosa]|nr:hypothetical protein [Aequorivita viscosa]